VLTTAAVVVVGFCNSFCQSNPSSGTSTSEINVRPLLFEKGEGELRTRRIHTDASVPASSQFILKVSPKNNGSQHLVAGTEDLAPGATLPKHRHLTQDETAGGLVFIPANTWVSAKNIGAEPISLTFIFSAPGFEDTMRCNSVPAGEKPTPITPEEQNGLRPPGACRKR
jgi:quercetin dioxygenase-like cupin family protein